MANALDLIQAIPPVRMLLVGYPGSGKTGSLVSLLNAGFKMRVLDFDGNLEPVFTFAQRDKLANLDILQLKGADAVKMGSHVIEANGVPHAFADAVRAMDRWTYKRGEETIDLGSSKDWGPDTVVVLDSLTSMGEAALLRAAGFVDVGEGPLGHHEPDYWGSGALMRSGEFRPENRWVTHADRPPLEPLAPAAGPGRATAGARR